MRYVSSKINAKVSDDIYRFYIANGIKILTGNTARFAGGTELTKTFREIIMPVDEQEEQEQGQEAQDVIDMMRTKIAKMRGVTA